MQHDEEKLSSIDRELELSLGRLEPRAGGLDRGLLMYHAGQMSARRSRRAWQSVAAVLAVAACVLVACQLRPVPPPAAPQVVVVERVIYQPAPSVPAPAPQAQAADWVPQAVDLSYLKLRDDVLAKGIDALPEPPKSSSAEGDQTQLRDLFPGLRQLKGVRIGVLSFWIG